ncbi:hypothetical protein E2C01_057310 [Portunus trituberculatus]|uniref:Uncharacterized protein n=1 Tax=Portunus trituberculatus TaxID=210409 RepID=A0A5B7H1I7_PORTR|nr:hypothetical protein [Portunus trituberculatus]
MTSLVYKAVPGHTATGLPHTKAFVARFKCGNLLFPFTAFLSCSASPFPSPSLASHSPYAPPRPVMTTVRCRCHYERRLRRPRTDDTKA